MAMAGWCGRWAVGRAGAGAWAERGRGGCSLEKMSHLLTFSDSSRTGKLSEPGAYYKYLRPTVDMKITLTN